MVNARILVTAVSAVLAGSFAAAIAAAPAAVADRGDNPGPPTKDRTSVMDRPGHKFTPVPRAANRSQLSSDFSSDLPTGWKNEALWARPGAPGGGPFGAGPKPPVIALD